MVMRGTANLFGQYFEEHKHLEVSRADKCQCHMPHLSRRNPGSPDVMDLHPVMILEGIVRAIRGCRNRSLVCALTPPPPPEGWTKRDGFRWTDETLQWFVDRGCEWVKPAMDPGDFVLWDSRTAHYGAAPMEEKKRFAICERARTQTWPWTEARLGRRLRLRLAIAWWLTLPPRLGLRVTVVTVVLTARRHLLQARRVPHARTEGAQGRSVQEGLLHCECGGVVHCEPGLGSAIRPAS